MTRETGDRRLANARVLSERHETTAPSYYLGSEPEVLAESAYAVLVMRPGGSRLTPADSAEEVGEVALRACQLGEWMDDVFDLDTGLSAGMTWSRIRVCVSIQGRRVFSDFAGPPHEGLEGIREASESLRRQLYRCAEEVPVMAERLNELACLIEDSSWSVLDDLAGEAPA